MKFPVSYRWLFANITAALLDSLVPNKKRKIDLHRLCTWDWNVFTCHYIIQLLTNLMNEIYNYNFYYFYKLVNFLIILVLLTFLYKYSLKIFFIKLFCTQINEIYLTFFLLMIESEFRFLIASKRFLASQSECRFYDPKLANCWNREKFNWPLNENQTVYVLFKIERASFSCVSEMF